MALNGYQHMVLEYYVNKVRAISKNRNSKLKNLGRYQKQMNIKRAY